MAMYKSGGKRAVDIAVAGGALLVAALPMAAVAFAIRVSMGSPIVFRQIRTGRDGKPFEVLKFRTMLDKVPGDTRSSSERITKLGRFLRSTSLDELPQLVNVLRGEMSIVGPRPLLPEYDELYSPQHRRRFEATPGITGLAQISGRSSLRWHDKFDFDVEYVDNISLRRDLAIIVATAAKVAGRSSTTAVGGGIQERFDGTN